MTRIKLQEQVIAESFVKHIKQTLLPQLRLKSDWHPIISLYEEYDDESDSLRKEQYEAAKLTVARADHLLNDIQDRIDELRTLEENARKTAAAVSLILLYEQILLLTIRSSKIF